MPFLLPNAGSKKYVFNDVRGIEVQMRYNIMKKHSFSIFKTLERYFFKRELTNFIRQFLIISLGILILGGLHVCIFLK